MRSRFHRSKLTLFLAIAFVGMPGVGSVAAQGKPPAAPKAAPQKGGPGLAKPGNSGKPGADTSKGEAAKKIFEDAEKKLDAGNFQAAYWAFKEADDLVAGPVPKFLMAESLDRAGDVHGAQRAYEDFLASDPPTDKHQARIDVAKARIEALKKAPAEITLNLSPSNALPLLDGIPQNGNVLKLSPGKHTISARAEGFDEVKVDLEVGAADKQVLSLALPPAPPPPPPAVAPPKKPAEVAVPVKPSKPEEKPIGPTIPGIIALGGAGASAVVGGVFGVLALRSKSDYNKTPTQSLFDRTQRDALGADVGLGLTAALGVTGLVLLLTNHEAPPASEPDKQAMAPKGHFVVAPWGGASGGGAFGMGTF